VFASRSTYSEPLAQILFLGGLCLVIDSLDGDGIGTRVLAAVGGLALGLTLLVRIDGASDILPVIPYLGMLLIGRRRQAFPMLGGLGVGVIYGLVDGLVLSRPYLTSIKTSLVPLALIVGVVIIATLVAIALRRDKGLPNVAASWLPNAAAALAVLVVIGFALRPYVQTVRAKSSSFFESIMVSYQRADHLPVAPERLYYELSLHWVFWYVGVPAVALGERHHADRQRYPGLDLRQRRTAPAGRRTVEADQLRGATADVEQHHAIGIRIDERRAAGGGERRLGFTVDDVELEPDLLGNSRAKLVAVLGGATSLGRDQSRPRHAAVAHLVAANGQRLDGPADRRVADASGFRDAFAQSDDSGKRVDDAKAVAGRARDQQPAIVGAKIEGGVGRPSVMGAAIVTRVAVGRPPAPSRPLLPRPLRGMVEAAGCPALVLHRVPSCRTEASGLDGGDARRRAWLGASDRRAQL